MKGDPGLVLARRVRLLCAVLLLAVWTGASQAAWVTLGGEEGARVGVQVIASSPERIVLEYTIPGFYATPVDIAGKTYYSITLPGEGRLIDRGLPALPRIARSVVIPDEARMVVRLLESQVVELAGFPVAPSKGDLLRSVNPSTVPYSFDPLYGQAVWWPKETAKGSAPYIMRDFRGMAIEVLPFQVEGSGGLLRAARRMRVEVSSRGSDVRNVLRRAAKPNRIAAEFADLYERHFINWNVGRYVSVPETGKMLVITDDSLHDAVLPYVQWKEQMGIPTRIVDVSTIGNTETQIAAYIDDLYNSEGLTYVLLVGDGAQVATAHAAGGSSDPTYSLIVGDDSYPEVIIGRFSAGSVAELQTQITRTIDYERTPMVGADWYHKAAGIGSAEGPGDNGEYDYQHVDVIRTKLLDYTYTAVDQIYDPGATAQMVSTALNEGRSIVNYTGHGSSIGWGTTAFSVADIGALTNDSMLPFVFSVGCVNGAFEGGTCFAESWLRAEHDGNATGAIGAYMSSVNQTWDPPMSAQDGFVDLLVQDQLHSVGGLCYNGSCRMMDIYGSAGANMFLTWHIFGDPSILIRTATPSTMTAVHADSIFVGEGDYPITVDSVSGALCALSGDGSLYGSAYTDVNGTATIHMPSPPAAPMTLTLTVTAYNRMPIITAVQVLPLSGPTLALSSLAILDGQTGDNDGLVGAGETVGLSLALWNKGVAPADSVTATIECGDPYAQIGVAERGFGQILPDSIVASAEPYVITLATNTPDQHVVALAINVHSAQKDWNLAFNLTSVAPVLGEGSVLIDDSTPPGNGSGIPEPGEPFFMQLRIVNSGHGAARNMGGVLTCADPNVEITDGEGECVVAAPGLDGLLSSFRIEISPMCPTPRELIFHASLTGDAGVVAELDYPVQIGDWTDDAEGDRGWTLGLPGDTATSGSWIREDPVGTMVDSVQAQPEDDHTSGASAVLCFVTGNGAPGAPAEDSDVDGGRTTLLSPVFKLATAVTATLEYWRWFSNNLVGGTNYEDYWTVDVTSNGTDWVPLEHTPQSLNSWRHRTFALEEYVTLTDQVQIRFVATDIGQESLVEAAVDDLTLTVTRTPVTDVPIDGQVASSAAITCMPNPLHGTGEIAYLVDEDGWVRLDLYDVAGRLVRSLIDGPASAGSHRVRIEAAAVPAGIYFVRLATPKILKVKQVAIIR